MRFELCVCVKIFHNLIKKYNNANIRNNRNRESRKAQNVTNSTKEREKNISKIESQVQVVNAYRKGASELENSENSESIVKMLFKR